MKKVKVQDAVGMILCHDLTKIVPGEFKGCAFKKGHVIREEDIPELLKLGKENIFVWEHKEGMLHEDEAALRIARAVAGERIGLSEPSEGKINLVAKVKGILKIDVERLNRINSIEHIMCATIHENQVVDENQLLAGTRVIPLVIEEERIRFVEAVCNSNPIINIRPISSKKVGIVSTGSEIYHGRIKDRFGPVVKDKVERYNCQVLGQTIVDDKVEMILKAINEYLVLGADMVIVTGGMSVDPDDLTPLAIRSTGAHIVSYGAPVLPGAMFLLAYLHGKTPIMGLPGCVMYSKTTVFDLILPRVLAGEILSKNDLSRLGHGGLCTTCPSCTFPACSFGKG
ncbi:molybdopterin-binding protein [Desulfitibacter alkalitolerans]|uniref:molybdopterin-binding protein n=1 Tax=Desulfitibacter alkalitolerans TaxID=264641 RepID=UPI00047F40F1|nr:molybdopterin-binding protein [Desulfitibacter alkalitolerans]